MAGQTVDPNSKFITITTLINIKGYVFRPNEQYCYESVVTLQIGCGCGGTPRQNVEHYRVKINGVFYDIPTTHAVISTVPISCEDQDYRLKIQGIGNRTISGEYIKNYNPYRNNPNPLEIAKSANNIPM